MLETSEFNKTFTNTLLLQYTLHLKKTTEEPGKQQVAIGDATSVLIFFIL